MEALIDFGARALLASPFLVSAVDKTVRPDAARSEIRTLIGRSMVRPPITASCVTVLAIQWAGGLFLLHPVTAPFGAIVLIVFLLPVTLIAHSFWSAPADVRANKRDHFFANIAIVGGLILVAAGALR